MRVYIINSDDLITARGAPVQPRADEIAVASIEELHAARLSGKRLLALWNGFPDAERLTKIGNRAALIDRLWTAMERFPIHSRHEPRSRMTSSRCCTGPRAQRSMR